MATQRISWTALPNGVSANGRLRLSVFIAPRLETTSSEATLTLFPDFLDWPQQIRAIRDTNRLAVNLSPDISVAPTILNPILDSDLWRALFPPTTPVCPYRYDSLSNRTIVTYSVSDVYASLKQIYWSETGLGYSPDRDRPTRVVERRISIDPRLQAILETYWDKGDPFEFVIDLNGNPALIFIKNYGMLLSYLFDSLDMVDVPDFESHRHSFTSERFRFIVIGILKNNDKKILQFHLGELLDLIVQDKPDPIMVPYFEALRKGEDPGFNDEIVGTETVTVENPPRSHADRLRKTISDIGQSVQGFYAVASGDDHRLPELDPRCQFDFHSVLSSLGQYPEVLRRLGIILDLEIDAIPIDVEFDTSLTVSGLSNAAGPTALNATPYTASSMVRANDQITDYQIRASPESEITRGFLNFEAVNLESQKKFDLILADVDGAAFKAVNFSQALAGMSDAAIFANGDYVGVPALRTAGIGLAQKDRANSLKALSAIADANNDKLVNNEQFTRDSRLFLDDLVRGFRVDIRDGKQGWRSLCQRDGTYTYPVPVGPVTQFNHLDEGWVVPSMSTQPVTSNTTKDMIHDMLFKWEGWSLAVNRPGKSVDPKGELKDRDTLKADSEKDKGVRIPLDFTAIVPPGSLPRLRFGRQYCMRVRVADLAGNGRSFEMEDTPEATSSPITFRRFEPLATPTLVLPRVLNPAANPADQGVNSERLVIHTRNAALEADTVKIDARDERFLAPAQTSQLMAEMYGVIDDVIGQGAVGDRALIYKMLAEKDAGTFVNNDGALTVAPEMLRADGTLILPYLPDPVVRGITLANLPGAPPEQVGKIEAGILRYRSPYSDVLGYLGKSVTQIPILEGNKWPDALPIKLSIVEGDQPPEWDNVQRVLTVFLPKAHTAQVLLSTFGNTDDHGILAWFRDSLPEPDRLRNVEDAVHYGVHRLITPNRAIMLVHAVQQPIGFPSIERLRIKPLKPGEKVVLGNTFVDLDSEFWTHAFSTVKLDVIAEWTQNVDEPASGPPKSDVPYQQIVLEQTVPLESEFDPKTPRDETFNFVSESVGITRVTRHEFRDTKYRHIRYRLQGLTRFREFFPPDPKIVNPAPPRYTRDSEVIELDIPNRARPLAPKIILVIPTFRWIRKQNADTVTSERICGLRVYLERVWHSSGDGELLGVVTSTNLDRDSFDQDIDTGFAGNEWTEQDPRITHWGADPIWQANQVWKFRAQDALKPDEVTDDMWAARVVNANWSGTLLNRSATKDVARIVCYAPEYDPGRDQWFTDIEFASGEIYFPFIRLALVRYQPISLDGAHFSEVALADFVQLPPNRTLQYTGLPGPTLTVTLTGSVYKGRVQRDLSLLQSPTRVVATVEHRLAVITDPDLGWEVIEGSGVTLESASDPASPEQVKWSGTLQLPAQEPERQYRVLVKEYEEFERWPVPPDPANPALQVPAERVTFAEAILV